jgi:hypothetical protein
MIERMIECMDLILPAIGRLLVARRPRPYPAEALIRLMPAGRFIAASAATNSRYLRLVFSIR